MKIPLSWLKEFVPFRISVEELAHRLTLGGLEVESIQNIEEETILEIGITPNRGDCLSILGIAREVSAVIFSGGPAFDKPRPSAPSPQKPLSSFPLKVSVSDSKGCPRYALATLSGIKVGPSPDWLARRLNLVGIRRINNIVDVTNYVLMELGQPLHAFDQKKIRGGKIVVRRAKSGEKILTLDGEEHELIPQDLIIADTDGPIAIAGVMGGKESEIDEGTTEIVLESAFFDPATVRKTARRLGIQTESSYRFERRVDPAGILTALSRAVSLIQSPKDPKEASKENSNVTFVDLNRHPWKREKVAFSPAQVGELLGGTWNPGEIRKALSRLSFDVRPRVAQRWEVLIPSYRGDIHSEVDLIEEVARLSGFDHVPSSFPVLNTVPVDTHRSKEKEIRRLLTDLGLQEVIHYSFAPPEGFNLLTDPFFGHGISLKNPLGQDSWLRPSLLPSLLRSASYHHRHKILDFRAFELRTCFRREGEGIKEEKKIAGLLTGRRLGSHWSSKVEETDFYDVKGIVERILSQVGVKGGTFEPGIVSVFHPGAVLKVGDKILGILGEIHPDLQTRFDLKHRVFAFELNWEALNDCKSGQALFKAFSQYPIVERDLAVVVDASTPAQSIQEFIHRQDPTIREVSVFDLYRGEQVPPGKKSLAFAIQLGQNDRTLTEEEVNLIVGRVIHGVTAAFEAQVR